MSKDDKGDKTMGDMMTIAVDEVNRKDFTSKVRKELDEICQRVTELEVMGLMNEDVDAKTFTMQRVLYDAYKMLGYELIRSRSYIYALIFKGKRYWLDTLSMVVKERGSF